MDSQSFDYWMAQGNYVAPPHQTSVFEMPPDLSKVPSLSGSPVRTQCSLFIVQVLIVYRFLPHMTNFLRLYIQDTTPT
jgi:AP-1-like factor